MYFYYGMTQFSPYTKSLVKPFAMHITFLQLSQMGFGVVIISLSVYFKYYSNPFFFFFFFFSFTFDAIKFYSTNTVKSPSPHTIQRFEQNSQTGPWNVFFFFSNLFSRAFWILFSWKFNNNFSKNHPNLTS